MLKSEFYPILTINANFMKNVFFILSSVLLIISACKKENNSSDDQEVKFKFTLQPIKDNRIDKANLPPPAYLVLYEDNGNILKEQAVKENEKTELTYNKEGNYSIGVFTRPLYDGESGFSYKIYQNVINNFVLDVNYPYPKPSLSSNVIIKGFQSIDSITNSNVMLFGDKKKYIKLNFNYSKNNNEYNVIEKQIRNPIFVYANGESLPYYFFISNMELEKQKTVYIDSSSFVKISPFPVLYKEEDYWQLALFRRNLDNQLQFLFSDPINPFDVVKSEGSLLKLPQVKTDTYFYSLTLKRPITGDEILYNYTLNIDLSTFYYFPTLGVEYDRLSNGTVLFKKGGNAKMIFTEGKYENGGTRIGGISNVCPIEMNNPSPILFPNLPSQIQKLYSLPNTKPQVSQTRIELWDSNEPREEIYKFRMAANLDPLWKYKLGLKVKIM